jgi:hypothetical protein
MIGLLPHFTAIKHVFNKGVEILRRLCIID